MRIARLLQRGEVQLAKLNYRAFRLDGDLAFAVPFFFGRRRGEGSEAKEEGEERGFHRDEGDTQTLVQVYRGSMISSFVRPVILRRPPTRRKRRRARIIRIGTPITANPQPVSFAIAPL